MDFGTAVNIGTASGGFGSSPPGGFGGFSGGNPFAISPTAADLAQASAPWAAIGAGNSSWSSAYNAAQGRRQQSGGGGGSSGGGGGGGGGPDLIPGGSGLFGGQGGGASQRFTPFSDSDPMTSTSGLYTPEEKPFSLGPTASWKPSVSFGEWFGDFVKAVAPAAIGAMCDIRLKTDIAPLENTEVNDALADIAFFVKEIRECA